jgi:hypothetical protein
MAGERGVRVHRRHESRIELMPMKVTIAPWQRWRFARRSQLVGRADAVREAERERRNRRLGCTRARSRLIIWRSAG